MQLVTDQIKPFLKSIGIKVHLKPFTESSFLPGVLVRGGELIVDFGQTFYPGDLLHEAGHIAVTPSDERRSLTGNVEPGKKANSIELAAICWSYAAARHLEIDLNTLFHSDGYKGQSEWFIEMFEEGNYIGLPLLQWMGICRRDDEVDENNPGFPTL